MRLLSSSRRLIPSLLFGAAALLAGCVHGITPSTQDELLDMVVRDLACQPASLTIARASIDGTLQHVEGCNQRAVYVLEGDHWQRRSPRPHDIRAWAASRHAQERCRTAQPYDGALEQEPAPTDCAKPRE